MGQMTIQEMAEQLGITSRTLRYWEQKELLCSSRDGSSNWRVYDQDTIEQIRFIKLFREMDISIKDIKKILDGRNKKVVIEVFLEQLEKLEEENKRLMENIELYNRCLGAINTIENKEKGNFLKEVEGAIEAQSTLKENLERNREQLVMENNPIITGALRIITLPAMRLAVCNIIGQAPEIEALTRILAWGEAEGLMGTARVFGYNSTEYKQGDREYGWAVAMTIPEQVEIPDCFKEKRIAGGLYASFNSSNEVYDSWKMMMKLLNRCSNYEIDETRQCMEELIPSGEGNGSVGDFYLTLLEPIKKISRK